MALDFQRDIIRTLVEEDALVIMSKGLGLHKIIFHLLKLHSSNKRIVFILNISPTEQQLFIEELTESGVALKDLPRRINAEYTMNERIAAYNDGGVHFANSTSLVMDFLYKRVPIDKVDGFFVLHSEKVTETSAEAFILRMFRKGNKEGFIKGFSEFPEAFLSGFAKSEKIMKNLFVKKIHLWPRFRDRVQDSLEKHTPNVVELSQEMTPAMKEIQSAIVEILKACIDEIKRTNMVDIGELKEEDIYQEWDQLLRGQLDPVWHKIGFQTKQLINDVASLRKLLVYLVRYDCVTFYQYLESLKIREVAQHSMWFYMEAADKLFRVAKNRVYITKRPAPPPTKKAKAGKAKKKKQESSSESENEEKEEKKEEPQKPQETQYITVLEENPKWSLLTEVLTEIEAEESAGTTGEPGKILVMVRDDKTCTQLQEYLEMGAGMLRKTFLRFIEAKEQQAQRIASKPKTPEPAAPRGGKGRWQKRGRGRGGSSRGGRGGKTAPTVGSLVDLQVIKKSLDMTEVTSPSKKRPVIESLLSDIFTVKDFETYFGVLPAPHIIIHSLSSKKRVLTDLRPKYVILYDTDVGFFRQLEVYKSENPGTPLRVYFLTYSESIEQFKYLNTLKREMDAFEHLIREKSIMAVPQEQDGKTVIDIARPEDTLPGNTRKGGKQEKIVRKNKIIVDSREFRSALPAILYQRDFEIVPATLEVGDYILTPEVAIERKSLSDLYQSFNSGRLFNQATALCKHFKKPMLLIEFDEDQPFSLLEETTDDITDNSIHTKLILLVKTFPTLKIIWSRSPYVTIDYFEELKKNQEDPDTSTVNVLTSGEDDETSEQAINILKTMPGITSFNYTKITNNVKNLQELCNMTLEQLTSLLGVNSAQQLYDFFNDSPPIIQSE